MKLAFSILLFSLPLFCFPQQQQDTLKKVIFDSTPWKVRELDKATVVPTGTYSKKPEYGGYSFDKVNIKKDFQFKRTYYLNNSGQSGSWTINGTWTIKHDTIILTPMIVKSRKGVKCNCTNQKYNLKQMVRVCATDTFVVKFKDNSLWSLKMEEYSRSAKK